MKDHSNDDQRIAVLFPGKMNNRRPLRSIVFLSIFIIVISAIASGFGIFTKNGDNYSYESIRGKEVTIYGKGVYRHMSSEVAPQGIAQDHVTLFLAIPLFLLALRMHRNGSMKGKLLVTGVLGYFLVTYTFYMAMAMYNELFLLYVILMGLSFYAFIGMTRSFEMNSVVDHFAGVPTKMPGSFLVFNSAIIALLWLSVIIPPLFDGTIVPLETEHYTTLIVQGFDLGILLPAAFISGLALRRRTPAGFLFGTVYLVFLSILMTALTAKIVAMYLHGYNVVPAIYIIPVFNILAIFYTIRILKNIKER